MMSNKTEDMFDEEADMNYHGRFIVRLVKDTLNTPHIIYPPMAEGQCHWEIGGKVVNASPECKHQLAREKRDE